MSNNDQVSSEQKSVKIWDIYIRLFHWLLVVCIIISVVSVRMDKMDVHFISGHVILALLTFRILWGLIGSRTARFVNFIRGPKTILSYLRDPNSKEFKSTVGHSPVAALSVIALIVVIGVQVATGLISDDEILLQGPLAKYVSGELSYQATWFHAINAKFIIGLVILHLLAIAFYYTLRKDNLVVPMITGSKKMAADDADNVVDLRTKNLAIAAVAIIVAIATAYFTFNA